VIDLVSGKHGGKRVDCDGTDPVIVATGVEAGKEVNDSYHMQTDGKYHACSLKTRRIMDIPRIRVTDEPSSDG